MKIFPKTLEHIYALPHQILPENEKELQKSIIFLSFFSLISFKL